jgi:hypothetical protein
MVQKFSIDKLYYTNKMGQSTLYDTSNSCRGTASAKTATQEMTKIQDTGLLLCMSVGSKVEMCGKV